VSRLPVVIVPLSGLNLNGLLVLILLLAGVAISLASALIPAWSAARTPIVEALRFSD
jgi:ABC-type lipoprotein release transport system permease subunit